MTQAVVNAMAQVQQMQGAIDFAMLRGVLSALPVNWYFRLERAHKASGKYLPYRVPGRGRTSFTPDQLTAGLAELNIAKKKNQGTGLVRLAVVIDPIDVEYFLPQQPANVSEVVSP